MSKISRSKAEEIAEKYWIDLDVIPLKDFQWGLERELETIEYSSSNKNEDQKLDSATKVVIEKLLDYPDYYSRLRKMEEKAEKEWAQKKKGGKLPKCIFEDCSYKPFAIGDEEDGVAFEPDWTPLMRDVYFNKPKEVASILEKGNRKIDFRSKETGTSALLLAVFANNLKLVRLLLDRGAKPNQKNKFGHTPLSIAVIGKNNDIAKELVISGVKPTNRELSMAKDDGFGEKNEELLKIFKCAKMMK